MTTTSHAFFTYAFMPTGSDVLLAVFGSVLPDIPFLIATPYCAWRKTGFCKGAIDAAKDVPGMGFLLKAGHSFVVWLLAALAVWWWAPSLLPFIWGWLGHNLADFVTHHGEAHAHFYPLTPWRFRSPISYYEWDHHALAFILVEYAVIGVILASWARHESLAATTAAMAAHPVTWIGCALAAVGLPLARRWWRRGPVSVASQVSAEG